jgi:hypothetical protein
MVWVNQELFEVGWHRELVEEIRSERNTPKVFYSEQMRLPLTGKKKQRKAQGYVVNNLI